MTHRIVSIPLQYMDESLHFKFYFKIKFIQNSYYLDFLLKGEVGQQGPPGPTLLIQPPDSSLYKGEKVIPKPCATVVKPDTLS